jgi:hypothetical protein
VDDVKARLVRLSVDLMVRRRGGNMQHPDREVQAAITRLCDALCMRERNTGRESVLIVREQGGFVFRASSGKPNIPEEITDAEMVAVLGV